MEHDDVYSYEGGVRVKRHYESTLPPAALYAMAKAAVDEAVRRDVEEKAAKRPRLAAVATSASGSASASASADSEVKQSQQLQLQPHQWGAGVYTPISSTHPECKVHDQLVLYPDIEEDVKLIDEGIGMVEFRDCAILIARYGGRHIIEPLPLTEDVVNNSMVGTMSEEDAHFMLARIAPDESKNHPDPDPTECLKAEVTKRWGTHPSPLTVILALDAVSKNGGSIEVEVTHNPWDEDDGPSEHVVVSCRALWHAQSTLFRTLICPLCYVDLNELDDDTELSVNSDHKSCMRTKMDPRVTLDVRGMCDRPVMGSYIRVPTAKEIMQLGRDAMGMTRGSYVSMVFADPRTYRPRPSHPPSPVPAAAAAAAPAPMLIDE